MARRFHLSQKNNGTEASVTVINPFDTTAIGSIEAYVNGGLLSGQFTLDNFDAYNNPRLFYSNLAFVLTPNDTLDLPAAFLTPDDYVLIKGILHTIDTQQDIEVLCS